MYQDTIYLIVGQSGAGKDSIVNKMCELKPDDYRKVISYTTRPKRYEDEDTHIFVTDEEYHKAKNIVAYTRFNNYRYWATQEQCEECNLYIIDPAGVEFFKNNYHGNKRVITINIKASLRQRFMRMMKRGDGIKKTISRLINDRKEFKNFYADYVIHNNNFMYTVVRIMDYTNLWN